MPLAGTGADVEPGALTTMAPDEATETDVALPAVLPAEETTGEGAATTGAGPPEPELEPEAEPEVGILDT